MRIIRLLQGICAAAALATSSGVAVAGKDRLVVDLVGEPNSLDPHVQWNPDSYYVYRNIFDNLLTRDDGGDIVPQIAKSWKIGYAPDSWDSLLHFATEHGYEIEEIPTTWRDRSSTRWSMRTRPIS